MHSNVGARPGARRMVSLGKVTAPKPVNLPSQRSENNGLDPNVVIVPKTSSTWGNPNADPNAGRDPSPSGPWGPQPGQPAPPAQPAPAPLPPRAIPAAVVAPPPAWGGAGVRPQGATGLLKRDEFPTLGTTKEEVEKQKTAEIADSRFAPAGRAPAGWGQDARLGPGAPPGSQGGPAVEPPGPFRGPSPQDRWGPSAERWGPRDGFEREPLADRYNGPRLDGPGHFDAAYGPGPGFGTPPGPARYGDFPVAVLPPPPPPPPRRPPAISQPQPAAGFGPPAGQPMGAVGSPVSGAAAARSQDTRSIYGGNAVPSLERAHSSSSREDQHAGAVADARANHSTARPASSSSRDWATLADEQMDFSQAPFPEDASPQRSTAEQTSSAEAVRAATRVSPAGAAQERGLASSPRDIPGLGSGDGRGAAESPSDHAELSSSHGSQPTKILRRERQPQGPAQQDQQAHHGGQQADARSAPQALPAQQPAQRVQHPQLPSQDVRQTMHAQHTHPAGPGMVQRPQHARQDQQAGQAQQRGPHTQQHGNEGIVAAHAQGLHHADKPGSAPQRFGQQMPQPTPDGRLGSAAAGQPSQVQMQAQQPRVAAQAPHQQPPPQHAQQHAPQHQPQRPHSGQASAPHGAANAAALAAATALDHLSLGPSQSGPHQRPQQAPTGQPHHPQAYPQQRTAPQLGYQGLLPAQVAAQHAAQHAQIPLQFGQHAPELLPPHLTQQAVLFHPPAPPLAPQHAQHVQQHQAPRAMPQQHLTTPLAQHAQRAGQAGRPSSAGGPPAAGQPLGGPHGPKQPQQAQHAPHGGQAQAHGQPASQDHRQQRVNETQAHGRAVGPEQKPVGSSTAAGGVLTPEQQLEEQKQFMRQKAAERALARQEGRPEEGHAEPHERGEGRREGGRTSRGRGKGGRGTDSRHGPEHADGSHPPPAGGTGPPQHAQQQAQHGSRPVQQPQGQRLHDAARQQGAAQQAQRERERPSTGRHDGQHAERAGRPHTAPVPAGTQPEGAKHPSAGAPHQGQAPTAAHERPQQHKRSGGPAPQPQAQGAAQQPKAADGAAAGEPGAPRSRVYAPVTRDVRLTDPEDSGGQAGDRRERPVRPRQERRSDRPRAGERRDQPGHGNGQDRAVGEGAAAQEHAGEGRGRRERGGKRKERREPGDRPHQAERSENEDPQVAGPGPKPQAAKPAGGSDQPKREQSADPHPWPVEDDQQAHGDKPVQPHAGHAEGHARERPPRRERRERPDRRDRPERPPRPDSTRPVDSNSHPEKPQPTQDSAKDSGTANGAAKQSAEGPERSGEQRAERGGQHAERGGRGRSGRGSRGGEGRERREPRPEREHPGDADSQKRETVEGPPGLRADGSTADGSQRAKPPRRERPQSSKPSAQRNPDAAKGQGTQNGPAADPTKPSGSGSGSGSASRPHSRADPKGGSGPEGAGQRERPQPGGGAKHAAPAGRAERELYKPPPAVSDKHAELLAPRPSHISQNAFALLAEASESGAPPDKAPAKPGAAAAAAGGQKAGAAGGSEQAGGEPTANGHVGRARGGRGRSGRDRKPRSSQDAGAEGEAGSSTPQRAERSERDGRGRGRGGGSKGFSEENGPHTDGPADGSDRRESGAGGRRRGLPGGAKAVWAEKAGSGDAKDAAPQGPSAPAPASAATSSAPAAGPGATGASAPPKAVPAAPTPAAVPPLPKAAPAPAAVPAAAPATAAS